MDAMRMLYLHALSPIHSGTGQSSGIIDLPVAREVTTNWPYLPGSTVKGVLRDACHPGDGADMTVYLAAFGPDTDNAADFAGALWFSDARLLCLPVRSLYGTFAWVSCPLALERWKRDRAHGGDRVDMAVPTSAHHDEILIGDAAAEIVSGGRVFLNELDLRAPVGDGAAAISSAIAAAVFEDQAWRDAFQTRFGIVSNDVFTFLTETGTEVTARVRLDDDKKTVQPGALWYEEAAPAETVFSCPVIAAPRAGQPGSDELFEALAPGQARPVQIGGNASVGRGLTRLRLAEVSA